MLEMIVYSRVTQATHMAKCIEMDQKNTIITHIANQI